MQYMYKDYPLLFCHLLVNKKYTCFGVCIFDINHIIVILEHVLIA